MTSGQALTRPDPRRLLDPRRLPLDGALVVVVALGYTLPMFAESFVVPKGFRPITEEVPDPGPVVDLVTLLCNTLVLVACLAVVVLHRRDLRRLASPVLLLVAAWGVGITGLLAFDAELSRRLVQIPLICLAFALVRPGLRAVRALGWVTATLAAVSLVLAVLRPDAVRYDLAASLADDKFVWGYGILAGPFGSGNNLGLALAVGLPSVLLLPRRWVRTAAVVVVLLALAWTFSRTSWFAALAAVGLGAVVTWLPRLRRPAATLALGGLGLVALVLPLVVRSETAFSNRGLFWRQGLDAWSERPWTGWGPDYYQRVAQSADNLGGFAFHAHNQALHLLVTGGVLLFAVVVAAFVWAGARAVRSAAAGRPWAAMVMTALLVCATFEVPLGVVDRAMFFPFVLVPLCLLLTGERPARRAAGVTAGG